MTLTLSNLSQDALRRLESESRRTGRPIESIAGDAIRLGMAFLPLPATAVPGGDDLATLAGTWSEADLQEFEDSTSQFRQIDRELWE